MSLKSTRLGRLSVLAAVMTLCLANDARAADAIVLMTDFPAGPSHGPLFLAQRKGWFRDAGLDVTIEDGKGSTSTINLVGAGRIDVGYVGMGGILPAREAGMKLKSFAVLTRKTDLAVMYANDSKITTPKDMAGKRVLCFPGSVWAPFITSFMLNAGVDPKRLPIMNVAVNAMAQLYIAGEADAMFTSGAHTYPFAGAKRPSREFLASDYGIVLPGYGLIATEKTIATRGDALKRLAAVVTRAWQYMADGHEQEVLDLTHAARPDASLPNAESLAELKNWEALIATPSTRGKPIGWQSERDWADAIKTEQTAGLIGAGHRPDEYYTNALLP